MAGFLGSHFYSNVCSWNKQVIKQEILHAICKQTVYLNNQSLNNLSVRFRNHYFNESDILNVTCAIIIC